MSNYVNNLNELINTKNEFKEIIIESGQTPGEVFSYYPNMIRNAIAAGGGSLVDYPTYTYVATYYPDFTYLFSYVGDALSGIDVDIDLSSYVTKDELSSYVTKDELSAQSYVTNTYVYNNYVKKGADISTPVAAIGNLRVAGELKVNANTYSYNIIPQENNTYTLGDANHLYAAAYATSHYTSDLTRIYSTSNYNINFNLNGANRYSMDTLNFSPINDNTRNLGSSTARWGSTYTTNLYSNTAYLQDTSYSSSVIPKETNTYTLGDASHLYSNAYTNNIFMDGHSITYRNSTSILFSIANRDNFIMLSSAFCPSRVGMNLGMDYVSNKWNSTYTANIYADNAYISNYNNLIWTGTSAEYASLSDYTSYQIYLIKES